MGNLVIVKINPKRNLNNKKSAKSDRREKVIVSREEPPLFMFPWHALFYLSLILHLPLNFLPGSSTVTTQMICTTTNTLMTI